MLSIAVARGPNENVPSLLKDFQIFPMWVICHQDEIAAEEPILISNFRCGTHGGFYRSSVLCNNQTIASKLK